MSDKIFPFEIPVPPDSELRAEYISLGWYEIPAGALQPARLKWSHARGSPMHPSDPPMDATGLSGVLAYMDRQLLDRLQSKLPNAADFEGESVDVNVIVAVRFKRVARRQRHKGASPYALWEPCDASMIIGDHVSVPD